MKVDKLPPGEYDVDGYLKKIDKRTGVVEFKLTRAAYMDLQLQIFKDYSKYDPQTCFKLLKNSKLPDQRTREIEEKCLQTILQNINTDISISKKKINGSNNDVAEAAKLRNLQQQEARFKKALENNSNRKNQAAGLFEIKKKYFYLICFEINRFNILLNDTFSDEEKLNLLNWMVNLFRELTAEDPSSLQPFFPFLTFLAGMWNREALRQILGEAKERSKICTYEIVFRYWTWQKQKEIQLHVLRALQDTYPEDILLRTVIDQIQNETPEQANLSATLDISFGTTLINEALELALVSLQKGNFQGATATLTKIIDSMISFSQLHRYLSLAFAVQEDLQEAVLEYSISTQLQNPSTNSISPYFHNCISQLRKSILDVEQKDEVNKKINDPLPSFLLLLQLRMKPDTTEVELYKHTRKFFTNVHKSLETNLEELPIIYLAFINLKEKLSPLEPIQLLPLLWDLLRTVLKLAARQEASEDWIHQISTLVNAQEKVIIDEQIIGDEEFINCIIDTNKKIESQAKPDHLFTFSDDFALTPTAEKEITKALVQELSIWILAELMQAGRLTPKETELTFLNHPLLFSKILHLNLSQTGLRAEEPLLYGKKILNEYFTLPADQRPLVDPALLNWSLFSIFSQTFSDITGDKVDQEIHNRYSLPEKLTLFHGQIKTIWKQPKMKGLKLQHETKRDIVLRDFLFALEAINARSKIHTISVPSNDTNYYEIFKCSQQLFGWQDTESFEQWGIRLKKHPFLLSKYETFRKTEIENLENITTSSTEQPSMELPVNSNRTQRFLTQILKFWISFQAAVEQKTRDLKEQYAAPPKETPVTPERENNPETYTWAKKQFPTMVQLHDTLVKQQKAVKTEPSKNKNDPGMNESIKLEEFIAATYLAYACDERPNLYLQENHEHVYRLLLEVTINRLITRILIQQGAHHWQNLNDNWLNNRILKEFKNTLWRNEDGIVEFHGPENHPADEGPQEEHYNGILHQLNGKNIAFHLFLKVVTAPKSNEAQ